MILRYAARFTVRLRPFDFLNPLSVKEGLCNFMLTEMSFV